MLPISTSFQAAQSKLNNEERGRVFTFIMKFDEDPSHPSISFERVQQAKSPNLWSGRVSKELRAILQKDGETWIAVYVGRHDEAYEWASKHIVGKHPLTGIWQVVPMPVVTGSDLADTGNSPALFASRPDNYLLSLGVPEIWLPTLRQIRSDDELLNVVEKLPQDVGERLLDLAAGKLVTPPAPVSLKASPVENEDASRDLIMVKSRDELRMILDAPMAKWIAFLHPTQKKLARGESGGAVKVTGSAGTGKTVVAMHRARHLAAQGHRVFLTSYVNTLCRNLERNLRMFCLPEELERITVSTVHRTAHDLVKAAGENWQPVDDQKVESLLKEYAKEAECPLDAEGLFAEWRDVIEEQGIATWDEYRAVSRVGRGRALTVKDRKAVWQIIERLQRSLAADGAISFSGLCRRAAELVNTGRVTSPFDAVVVDEMQDLRAQEMLMLGALAPRRRLMLVGDGGQRIYAGKVSLKSLGIDVRGRSHILRLNYRTTEQIRRFADGLLDAEADDLDGGREARDETRSLLQGPEPRLQGFDARPAQNDFVLEQIERVLNQGRAPDEIAVFARQARLLDQIETRLKRAGVPSYRLSKEDFPHEPAVNLGTMHRAKGLEFKVVFVIDAAENELPPSSVLSKKTDEQARADFLEQERQLLYVSITRARDAVFVTWAGEPSKFLIRADRKGRRAK
ncbi:MAG: 3'-5' exonuclease [Blastocatellia bacterium]